MQRKRCLELRPDHRLGFHHGSRRAHREYRPSAPSELVPRGGAALTSVFECNVFRGVARRGGSWATLRSVSSLSARILRWRHIFSSVSGSLVGERVLLPSTTYSGPVRAECDPASAGVYTCRRGPCAFVTTSHFGAEAPGRGTHCLAVSQQAVWLTSKALPVSRLSVELSPLPTKRACRDRSDRS